MQKTLKKWAPVLIAITLTVIIGIYLFANWRNIGNKISNLFFQTVTQSDKDVDLFGTTSEKSTDETSKGVWD